MNSICSRMWSVARHRTDASSMCRRARFSRKSSVYSCAISHALLPVRRAPFSILSSPVSASDVRCPTSVMFITCRTA